MIPILKIACVIDIAKVFLATPYSCDLINSFVRAAPFGRTIGLLPWW